MKANKKSIKLVVQQKGGVGKSIFSFMYGEKHRNAKNKPLIYDADKKNLSTFHSLKFLNVPIYDFYLEDDIKDNAFYEMMESFCEKEIEANEILLDCSVSVSENFIKTFKSLKSRDIYQYLKEHDVVLYFYVIISGGDTYAPTLDYLLTLSKTLFASNQESQELSNHIKIVACRNLYKSLPKEAEEDLRDKCMVNNIELKEYYLTKNTGEGTEEVITTLLTSQIGLESLYALTRGQFKNGIQDFDF